MQDINSNLIFNLLLAINGCFCLVQAQSWIQQLMVFTIITIIQHAFTKVGKKFLFCLPAKTRLRIWDFRLMSTTQLLCLNPARQVIWRLRIYMDSACDQLLVSLSFT